MYLLYNLLHLLCNILHFLCKNPVISFQECNFVYTIKSSVGKNVCMIETSYSWVLAMLHENSQCSKMDWNIDCLKCVDWIRPNVKQSNTIWDLMFDVFCIELNCTLLKRVTSFLKLTPWRITIKGEKVLALIK